jgi:hypothetical protein
MDGVAAVLLVLSSLGISVGLARVALNEVFRLAGIHTSARSRR